MSIGVGPIALWLSFVLFVLVHNRKFAAELFADYTGKTNVGENKVIE
jgi:hypothetical protein